MDESPCGGRGKGAVAAGGEPVCQRLAVSRSPFFGEGQRQRLAV